MKILLTGGGTGGHFYPLIAVARALNAVADQEKITRMEIIYMAEHPYDRNLLLQNDIKFKKIYSGKVRRYFSLLNIIDAVKIIPGILKSIVGLYLDFPDVIFGKGGSESFPALVAARVLGIPVMIHESDAAPGKVNLWAGRFAKRIAISFVEAAEFFPKDKTALTGNPTRPELSVRNSLGAREYFNFDKSTPVIFVLGGSQGSKNINDNFLDILLDLLPSYQVIHQCGKNNYEEVRGRSEVILENSLYKDRYYLRPYLNFDAIRMAFGSADLIISRSGGGSIFEISASGLPSIVIPLTEAAQDHQRENAYSYAKNGSAVVVEESNLRPHILRSEIDRLFADKELLKKMAQSAKDFFRPDAAEKIARELINLAIEHK